MAIGGTTETAILALIFNATAWANYADNAASSPQTNIACALHTADPGTSGTQSTSESGLYQLRPRQRGAHLGRLDDLRHRSGELFAGFEYQLPGRHRRLGHGDELLDRQDRRRRHRDPVVGHGDAEHLDRVGHHAGADHGDHDHAVVNMNDFRRCLIELDVASFRKIQAAIAPDDRSPRTTRRR
jgi:hypothetical protein